MSRIVKWTEDMPLDQLWVCPSCGSELNSDCVGEKCPVCGEDADDQAPDDGQRMR